MNKPVRPKKPKKEAIAVPTQSVRIDASKWDVYVDTDSGYREEDFLGTEEEVFALFEEMGGCFDDGNAAICGNSDIGYADMKAFAAKYDVPLEDVRVDAYVDDGWPYGIHICMTADKHYTDAAFEAMKKEYDLKKKDAAEKYAKDLAQWEKDMKQYEIDKAKYELYKAKEKVRSLEA